RRLESMVMTDDRSVTRIRDGGIEFPSRHHPLIRMSVAAISRVPTPQQRITLQFLRHARAELGELHARYRRADDVELTTNAGGRLRLGIKRIVVARPASRPNQYAIDV